MLPDKAHSFPVASSGACRVIDALAIGFLVAALAPPAASQTVQGESKTTLCQLMANPERYAGQTVEVRATLIGAMETSVLIDDSCPHSDVSVWYGLSMPQMDSSPYALIDSLDALKKPDEIHWLPPAPVIFQPTKDSERMMRYCKRRKVSDVVRITATFRGRFDYIPKSKWLALKGPDGNFTAFKAFGHQNCCRAQLTPQSVTEFVRPRK
jgi:hypothetical protein